MVNKRPSSVSWFFYRTGHLFLANPVLIIAFVFRMFWSLKYLFGEFAESPSAVFKFIGRNLKQTAKALFRGLLPVMLFGSLGGYIIYNATQTFGTIFHEFFDLILMKHLLTEVFPLITAIIVAGRAGSAIAAKFAVVPAMHHRKNPHSDSKVFYFSEREISQQVVPQISATMLTTPLFYCVGTLCFLAGYFMSTTQSAPLDTIGLILFISDPEKKQFISDGVTISFVFGIIIGTVASAFGIRASEEYISRLDEMFELHNAIWESILTSFVLCSLVLFAKIQFADL